MNRLFYSVKSKLCPEGVWKLSDRMQILLEDQISKYPKENVSEEQTRYPTNLPSMRAFLDKFFARHYFQVQDSILSYMASEAFLRILSGGNLRVLDIGSGPAVTSLAFVDMLACILQNLKNDDFPSNSGNFKISFILNDTSEVCLSAGKQLLKQYFRPKDGIALDKIVTLKTCFPANISQLWQLCQHLGGYHFVSLSYILNPLRDQIGITGTVKGLKRLEKICTYNCATVILQDKFSESLIRIISNAIGKTCQKGTLRQYVYDSQNSKAQQTYSYFKCLSMKNQGDVSFFSKTAV